MLKRLNIFLCLATIISLTGAGGCKKGTFDINDVNPNVPSDVDPKFLLSGSLKTTAQLARSGDADFAELYMGYWSVSGDYIPDVAAETYQTSTGYYSDNWNSGYINMKNYRQMEALASGTTTGAYYVAMAKIMESFVAERLVDIYNNVPYTQALQGGVINFPKYDNAPDVYNGIIKQLDSAIAIIKSAPITAENPGKFDIMFGGTMSSWVQFANTLKLKLALNLTQYSGGNAFIQSALSGLKTSDFLGAGADAAVQPGYSNSSEDQQSPFYNDMGFSTSGAVQNNESYYRACSYIVNYMYSMNDTLRLYQLFAANTQSPAVVLGRPFGSTVSVGQDNQHISAMGPGLLKGPSDAAIILPASESLFMQAEAVQRGLLSGSAAGLYQTAVEESFRLLQVTNDAASADAWMAASNNGNVNFSKSTNPIQTIIFQEWIAVSGFDPVASWNNWRRLGIPTDLPVSIFNGSNTAPHVPYRLLYPTSEYSYNTSNVNAQGTINNMTSKIFWMP